jgi:poly(glycerol-phosphate) alpha-glucosyltransferase
MVVPNFTTIPEAPPPFLERDTSKFVFIGRIAPGKDCESAIRAFASVSAQLPGTSLVLYGTGDDEDRLKALAGELGLNDSVIFAGFTLDASRFYDTALASLHPSIHEGFSLSLLESMARGCPPIVYAYRYGQADLVTDGVNGLVVPLRDVDALTHAMLRLAGSPETARAMSEAAWNAARKYSRQDHLASWARVFEEIRRLKPYRNHLDAMTLESHTVTPAPPPSKQVTVQARVTLNGEAPPSSRGSEQFTLRQYNERGSRFVVHALTIKSADLLTYTLVGTAPSADRLSLCLEWNNAAFEIPLEPPS